MSARSMANLLAGMTDAELAELFQARSIPTSASWGDVFDAADALLTPESIRIALARVPREHTAAFRAAASGTPLARTAHARARSLALANDEGELFAATREVLAGEEFAETASNDDVAAPAGHDADSAPAHAAEIAFLTVARIADVLLEAARQPLALLQSGGLRSSERKRLLESGLDLDPETLDLLIAIARDGGLLTTGPESARLSTEGSAWLEHGFAARWLALASDHLARLPQRLTTVPVAQWPAEYPWDPRWVERAQHAQRSLIVLGLLGTNDQWTPWATALQEGNADASTALLSELVPHEVDRVFVQHDYSIIAPGPLEPRLDLALRRFSDAAPGGHASGYRLSAESIARALTSGMTAGEILEFLGEISLSGTPQPVEYLIRSTGERHGAVRVGAHPETGITVVTSDDAALLDRLAADRSLRMLSFSIGSEALATPVSPQNVHWALLDAGYPSELSAAFTTAAPIATPEPSPATDFTALISLIRRTANDDSSEAWLNRELELAARERGTIIVEVAMPDGSTRELTLQVNAFGGGRLRGLDRAAEVERTLPVSSIRSARSA